MTLRTACPDRAAWESFHQGRLEDVEIDRLGAHLDECGPCSALLDAIHAESSASPPAPSPGREPTPPSVVERLLRVGDAPSEEKTAEGAALGRYRLGPKLGEGGDGVVRLAVDATMNREVALKFAKASRGGEEATIRRRLFREAKANAAPEHPNIVTVYDSGEIDGVAYIASEYCRGSSLDAWLKERAGQALAVGLVARLVATLAEAVESAHRAGVLHRDVKPANILLQPGSPGDETEWGDFGHIPKLADFSLARSLTPSTDTQQPTASLGDAFRGTPGYLAPEQVLGRADRIDARTDVYGLGVLLYVLLTRALPFQGVTPTRVESNILHADPQPMELHRPGVPRDLRVICFKCLAKSNAGRYPSAGALAEDLRRFLAGIPIKARPPGPLERAWKFARRRPGATIGIAATILIVAGLIVHNRILAETNRKLAASERAQRRIVYASGVREFRRVPDEATRATFDRLLGGFAPEAEADPADSPRGFEWWLLKNDAERVPRERTIRAHDGPVLSVRFDRSDPTKLMSAGTDGLIKMWDLKTGRETRRFEGHVDDVNRAMFLPDGKGIASVGDDKTLRIWDEASGEAIRVFTEHRDRLFYVAASGHLVAAAGVGSEVCVWDLATGELHARLIAESKDILGKLRRIRCVRFPFDPPQVWAAYEDGSIKIWDIPAKANPTAKPLSAARAVLTGHSKPTLEFHIWPDESNRLVTVSSDGTGRILNTATGELHSVLKGHSDQVNTCYIMIRNGSFVATGSDDATIRIWDPRGSHLAILTGHEGGVRTIHASADEETLASGGEDGTIKLWRWREWIERGHGDQTRFIVDSLYAPFWCRLSPDGHGLLAAHPAGGFRIWDFPEPGSSTRSFPEMRPTRPFPAATAAIPAFRVSPDGRFVATMDADDHLCLYDANSATPIPRHRLARSASQWPPVFSPDGRTLAYQDLEKRVHLWSVSEGRDVALLDGSPQSAVLTEFTPDGKRLAALSTLGDYLLSLWDLERRVMLKRVTAHKGRSQALAISPDGAILATAGRDRRVNLWNAADLTLRASLAGHNDWVISLAFSPDGKTLVSGGRDGTVRFWQAETGLELFTAERFHAGPVAPLLFAPDGSRLVSVATPAKSGIEVHLWDAPRDGH